PGAFNAGLDPFGGSGHAVVTFNQGSTASFFTTSAFSYDGRFYGNLILDGNQSYDGGSGSNPLQCQNNLTIANGSSLALSMTSGGDLVLLGNLTDGNESGGIKSRSRTFKFK